jgi:predicted transcriptional regulator
LTCENPLCSCEPCECTHCRCGVTTLGDLERRVMSCIWQWPETEVKVRDVAGTLPEYAYTTVATVLDRLVAKGILRSRIVNRAKQYRAVGSSGAHTAVAMYDALFADADPASALRRFAQTLNDEEAAILRQAITPSSHS